eukprot:241979-Chlamydomonas_euryale.AAC.1
MAGSAEWVPLKVCVGAMRSAAAIAHEFCASAIMSAECIGPAWRAATCWETCGGGRGGGGRWEECQRPA